MDRDDANNLVVPPVPTVANPTVARPVIPVGAENVTVGAKVYPAPTVVILVAVTVPYKVPAAPTAPTVAVASAVIEVVPRPTVAEGTVPAGSLNVTVGTEAYSVPPSVTVRVITFPSEVPVPRVAVAVAVSPMASPAGVIIVDPTEAVTLGLK